MESLMRVSEDENFPARYPHRGVQRGRFATGLVAEDDRTSPIGRRRRTDARQQAGRESLETPSIYCDNHFELVSSIAAAKAIGDTSPNCGFVIARRDNDRYCRVGVARR